MKSPMLIDSGAGTPLLLFHAFPLNASMWNAQVGAFPSLRLLAFSLPGFDGDRPQDRGASLTDCARLGATLLDDLGIQNAIIGGCSMGGYIAMAFARLFPDRIAGMVLANTRAGADSEDTRVNRHRQAALVRSDGMQVLVDLMQPKLLGPRTRERGTELDERIREMILDVDPEGAAVMLEAMAARADSSDVLASLRVPSVVIVGEDDVLTPPEEARRIAALMPGSMLRVIPGAGHLSNMEAPEAFNAAIDGFISSIAHVSGSSYRR